MYLYKELNGAYEVVGLKGSSTPQATSEFVIEINQTEHDAIQQNFKTAEEAARVAQGPSLKERVEKLEDDVGVLKAV